MNTIFVYVLPILATLCLLFFWRYCTEWYYEKDTKFPTRFHILLFFLISLIPIVGLLSFIVLLGVYIYFRCDDDIRIKPNNFSKFWFDKEKNDE